MNTRLLADPQVTADRLARIRQGLESEFAAVLGREPHLFRLALNEAEALACLAGFPHLLLPALGSEKVAQLAAWRARQDRVRRWDPQPAGRA